MKTAFLMAKTTLERLKPHLTLHCFRVGEPSFSEIYSMVQANRISYYALHASHLLAKEEMAREKEVDSRSWIVAVQTKSKVVASLRLTTMPFELLDHNPHEFDDVKYQNYLEIGRLVTDPEIDQLNLALLVRYLLCGAGILAFEQLKAAGFAAICRPFRLNLFRKFGLEHQFDLFSAQRKIHYCFLSGTVEQILQTTSEMQANEVVFRKRLEKISLKA